MTRPDAAILLTISTSTGQVLCVFEVYALNRGRRPAYSETE